MHLDVYMDRGNGEKADRCTLLEPNHRIADMGLAMAPCVVNVSDFATVKVLMNLPQGAIVIMVIEQDNVQGQAYIKMT